MYVWLHAYTIIYEDYTKVKLLCAIKWHCLLHSKSRCSLVRTQQMARGSTGPIGQHPNISQLMRLGSQSNLPQGLLPFGPPVKGFAGGYHCAYSDDMQRMTGLRETLICCKAHQAYIHTCIQTYTYVYTHTHTHSYINTGSQAGRLTIRQTETQPDTYRETQNDTRKQTIKHQTNKHIYIHAYSHTYIHTSNQRETYTYMHKHIHTCMHTYMHISRHTYTHTHT